MRSRLSIIIIILIIVISCTLTKEEKLKKEMLSCLDKSIIFPEAVVFTSCIDDTISVSLNASFKVIHYVDSNGCIECRMNLKGWQAFANYLDSVSSNAVKTFIFIHPAKFKYASSPILKANYTQPVCIDMNDEFGITNRELLSHGFNTFLLDDKNRVVAVGYPITTPAIGDVYLKTIQKHLGLDITQEIKRPELYHIDMGIFNWKEPQQYNFVLHNISETTKEIDTIYTSCECTSAYSLKNEILAGDSSIVHISFKAEEPESFIREVFVKYSDNSEDCIQLEGVATE